jgi:hypothetical protein
MALPPWNQAGLLPPGAHRAQLRDLYERFVLDAPGREHREVLFAALDVHLRLLQGLVPAGKAWIDGSFATRRALPPEDVDIVVHPADWEAFGRLSGKQKARLYGLLTLQDVWATEPVVAISRLQPVGGVIDAFLCHPGHEATWDAWWSAVTDGDGKVVRGSTKGYAEVNW